MQEMPESKDVIDKGQQCDALLVAGSEGGMEFGRAVLLELSAQPGMNVQVGLSYETAALELGVNLLSGARSVALGSGDKCQ